VNVSILKKDNALLMDPIMRVKLEMEAVDLDSEQYDKMLNRLERLVRLKEEKKRISPDALVAASANLLGILIIVAYEQKHVVVSKGLQFVQRTIKS
jgi:hypothetical protein